MHIKEIQIDGFKSYANRTSINGFDRYFTAITGLNGSGKSNILDAICFLLGITTFSHIRASNLQELIYKYGNTGVNKASVQITFDNSNKKNSPIGMEDYDEIIVERTIYQGKTKYYLNGSVVKQENIGSLFQSVQLNIKNPHFLIMQGKVTQVVNMKPLEILGLLEETAGTSIYEMKKMDALKTIKKKENKLEEINKILMEEISPQLEKLIKDKQTFLTWKSRENEIQRMSKVLVAYEYMNLDLALNNRTNEIIQYKLQQENYKKEEEELKELISLTDKEIKNVTEKFGSQSNNSLKEIESKITKLIMELKNLKKQKENVRKNLEGNIQEINKRESEIEHLNINCDILTKQEKDYNSNLELIEKEYETKMNYLRDLERNMENATNGKSSDLSKDIYNLQKLMNDAKSNFSKTKTEKTKLKEDFKIMNDRLIQKKEDLDSFEKTSNDIKKNFEQLNQEKIDCKNELDRLDYNPKMIESIQKQIKEYEGEVIFL